MSSQLFSYLRPMEEIDLPWVLSAEERAYQFPWTMQGFVNSLDQGLNYILCSAQDQLLGYVCVLTVLDEAHILNFCVSPDFQKRGVGKAALIKLKDKLKESGFSIVFLEVRESNVAAQNLYLQSGFTKDGVRKGYYRSLEWNDELFTQQEVKEDAMLMSCTLKDIP